jgi:TrmH family RNA methyltransferase
MPVRIVQSQQNERLKELRRALRQDGSGHTGMVAIEGPNLLHEAQRAGLVLAHVFAPQESAHILEPLFLPAETDVLLLPRTLLCSALATETPQPLAALVRPPSWTWNDLIRPAPPAALLVVLCGLQDPGNLGTILRSAEAFGATGVVSLAGTVSAWNQKAVRASAGSVFRVPLLRTGLEECFTRLAQGGVQMWATAARDASPVADVALTGPVALLIGNEGNGVPADVAAKARGSISIPCPGPVESLNAAVAASVLLYEASLQRSASTRPQSKPSRSDR